MKRLLLLLTTITLSVMIMGCSKSENPLLSEFDTPHGTPPFELIKTEHFLPAFEEGIAQKRAEIDAIMNNQEEATFANTIEALERSGKLLSRVSMTFFPLTSSVTSDEIEKIEKEVQPMLVGLTNDIYLNPEMFERVKVVYNHYNEMEESENPLSIEEKMLLEDTYKSFTRRGANLDAESQARYREVTEELSVVRLDFEQNVLAETNAFSINIPEEDEDKVSYMPKFLIDAMARDAKEREQTGWTVTLNSASYWQFLTYSKERDIKEKLWMAYNSKCYGGEFDNRENLRKITSLRLEIANLLGYETYADYVLEERMAETVDNVTALLDELIINTKAAAAADYNESAEMAKKLDGITDFMPWDLQYYNEQVKSEKYDFNEEQIKPYLQLEKVQDGTLLLATKLYGVTFKESNKIAKYHPEVKVFEVYEENGDLLAVLYMDYFARKSKRGGAWMTSFRKSQVTEEGEKLIPFITLNLNFAKPAEGEPALLTFSEFVTVLHEFGHGLHGMFGEGKYASLTGTAVYRDFVELPSQILENWATEKEFLDLFAEHYETGEKIPAELVEKVLETKNFRAAYANVRQVSFGANDMAWHSIKKPVEGDVAEFEKMARKGALVEPAVEGMCLSTAFTHSFAGGYAAGYYSYKWAEVLEVDAYSLFEEKGIFNREVANSFRENILSKGGTEHPMKLYVKFRGHEPSTQPLIDRVLGK